MLRSQRIFVCESGEWVAPSCLLCSMCCCTAVCNRPGLQRVLLRVLPRQDPRGWAVLGREVGAL